MASGDGRLINTDLLKPDYSLVQFLHNTTSAPDALNDWFWGTTAVGLVGPLLHGGRLLNSGSLGRRLIG